MNTTLPDGSHLPGNAATKTAAHAGAPPPFDARATAALLDYHALVATLGQTCVDYAKGEIVSPERIGVPLRDGGVMLSMPASAHDIAIHKLVTVCPRNKPLGLPTIHGQVVACDVATGEQLFVLDGPTVTGRRTAAISMLGINMLHDGVPREVIIIGTGTQASNHVEAIAALFPLTRMYIKARVAQDAEAFCRRHGDRAHVTPLASVAARPGADVVITATTSKQPVYSEAATAGRLVIGVGAFTPDAAEIDAATVLGSELFVDDPFGAKHEAGDLIQAGADWSRVRALAEVVGQAFHASQPVLFKSVGCGAWDLAACRVAREALGNQR